MAVAENKAATQEWENPELPLLVCVPIETGGNASLIDTELYCVNLTSRTFDVDARSESHTTVDEETGAGIAHGSPPKSVVLAPGEAAQVGDVAAWEWDGAVGMSITYRPAGDDAPIYVSYLPSHFRRDSEPLVVPSNGKSGHIITPFRIQIGGGPLIDDFRDVYSRSYHPLYGASEPTDLPDGRTRLIEMEHSGVPGLPLPDPVVVPKILDRATRRVVLSMGYHNADVRTRWCDGAISLQDRLSGLKLTIDVAGDRFRDEAAPDAGWQPLGGLQAYVDARVPHWVRASPPPTREKTWWIWASAIGGGLLALIVTGLVALVVIRLVNLGHL